MRSRVKLRPLAAALCAVASAASAFAQGFAPGAHFYEPPADQGWNRISLADDGKTVAGELYHYQSATVRGFTLGANGVINAFPELSRVYDVSDNGAYTSGYVTRRAADGTTDTVLNYTRPVNSFGGAHLSGNGQVMAGTIEVAISNDVIEAAQPYMWTPAGGFQYLGYYIPGGYLTFATNISRDGSRVVGWGSPSIFGGVSAWQWTQATGYSLLPDLPDARFVTSGAYAANADGSIVVGYGNNSAGRSRALVWHNGVPTPLPAVTGYRDSRVTGLCDDGSILVGKLGGSLVGLPETAAIWTAGTNWVPAMDYLRASGLDIPSYYTCREILISADGRTFAARVFDGSTPDGILMVAVVPAPGGLALIGVACLSFRRARG